MIEYGLDYKTTYDETKVRQIGSDAFKKIIKEMEDETSGYYKLPEESQELIKRVKHYGAGLNRIDTIAVIGIGGSSLGTKAIHALLKHKNKDAKRVLFFENPDPIDISEKLLSINKEATLFIVISKSGSTVETISIFKTIISNFHLNIEKNKHIVAITDQDSALYKFAQTHEIQTFTLKENVGGRFSVLSSVGVVPLTLAGYDTSAILDGAKAMRDRFFANQEEHLLKKAALLALGAQKETMNVLFSYSNTLQEFTQWYVQLWGESLGKINKNNQHTGLTPIGHIGSVDQHSFLQLIIEGPRDKTVTFIKIDDFENQLTIPDIWLEHIEKSDYVNGHTFNELINAECDATMQSVSQQGISVDMITLDKIDEQNVGEMIMYYELLTSLVGSILDINTYNQEGVELGKRILVEKFSDEA